MTKGVVNWGGGGCRFEDGGVSFQETAAGGIGSLSVCVKYSYAGSRDCFTSHNDYFVGCVFLSVFADACSNRQTDGHAHGTRAHARNHVRTHARTHTVCTFSHTHTSSGTSVRAFFFILQLPPPSSPTTAPHTHCCYSGPVLSRNNKRVGESRSW